MDPAEPRDLGWLAPFENDDAAAGDESREQSESGDMFWGDAEDDVDAEGPATDGTMRDFMAVNGVEFGDD